MHDVYEYVVKLEANNWAGTILGNYDRSNFQQLKNNNLPVDL